MLARGVGVGWGNFIGMIVIEVIALPLLFLSVVILSNFAGLAVAWRLPWTAEARAANIDTGVGLVVGPFLFGAAGIIALLIFPGASHTTHLISVLTVLVAIAATWFLGGRFYPVQKVSFADWDLSEKVILGALVVAGITLIILTLLTPLTQNDALEYMIAAKELYAARSMGAYPVLDPVNNVTGFYGPWTHPPLYVALIYLANIIQGHADLSAYGRLIAPWVAIAGSGLVFCLGRLVGRLTGLIAALIFLSVPLYFLGAGSALLDPLPVAGFTLVVAAVAGLNKRPAFLGAGVGLFLGASLWTHSQAVLFVPLALAAIGIEYGAVRWKECLRAGLVLLGVGLLVGCWPYARNVIIFGAPVSDNPSVFALPGLFWEDYFIVNRGLNNPAAMVQYGILKGWFAFESYGLVFWGMTVGAVFFLFQQGRKGIYRVIAEGAGSFPAPVSMLWLAVALVGVYLTGMVLSVSLGIEHMVKNERYLLVTLPVVSVLCAYGYEKLMHLLETKFSVSSAEIRKTVIFALVLGLALQLGTFVAYAFFYSNRFISVPIWASMHDKIFSLPQYEIFPPLHADKDTDTLVLSLRPADMYYSDIRMISYLDERLLPFYEDHDVENAYRKLRSLGVTHVHIADYGLPPLYNSQLWKILRDPKFSTLEWSSRAAQIYSLKEDTKSEKTKIDLKNAGLSWTREEHIGLSGRKGIVDIPIESHPFDGWTSHGGLPLDLMHRNWLTVLYQGKPLKDGRTDLTTIQPHEKGLEYALDLELAGRGLVKVYVDEYSKVEGVYVVRSHKLSTFELSDNQPERSFGIRFEVPDDAEYFLVALEHVGSSWLRVDKAMLERIKREN